MPTAAFLVAYFVACIVAGALLGRWLLRRSRKRLKALETRLNALD